MAKAVFCVATSEFQAESIVNEIKVAGFSDDDISVLLPEKAGILTREWQEKAPGGNGGLGWLSGIGLRSIPGDGVLIATGPIMTALTGAGPGDITGALSGMGLPEPEARRYEQKVRAGNILISVRTGNPDQATRAANIFEQAGAEDIATTSEKHHYPAPEFRKEQ